AALGALECLRGGNTTMLEIGTRVPDYAKPVAAAGLRVVFGQTASDLDPAGVREDRFTYPPALAEKTLRSVDDVISAWHGAEKRRITGVVAAHAPEACSPELLRAARELAERRDVHSTIHLDQSHWEVESVMRVRGVRPAEYLFQHDFLSPRLVAAHCRFVSPGEISHLGRSRVSVSHNAAMAARRAAAPATPPPGGAGWNPRHGHRQHGGGHAGGDAPRPLRGAHLPPGRRAASGRRTCWSGACATARPRSAGAARWAASRSARR